MAMRKPTFDLAKIESSLDVGVHKLWDGLVKTGKAVGRESKETYVASKILLQMIQGKPVTPEQISFLKNQSVDIGKALAIIGLQAVPGSSVAIIALEKVARKYGFSLFPSSQTIPSDKK